jgi:predicted DNA-binding transcriptional regulator AlpA
VSDREKQRREEQMRRSYSLDEWCDARRISRAMFYKLDKQGLAPKTHRVGAKRLISDEADAAWLAQAEANSADAGAGT